MLNARSDLNYLPCGDDDSMHSKKILDSNPTCWDHPSCGALDGERICLLTMGAYIWDGKGELQQLRKALLLLIVNHKNSKKSYFLTIISLWGTPTHS